MSETNVKQKKKMQLSIFYWRKEPKNYTKMRINLIGFDSTIEVIVKSDIGKLKR